MVGLFDDRLLSPSNICDKNSLGASMCLGPRIEQKGSYLSYPGDEMKHVLGEGMVLLALFLMQLHRQIKRNYGNARININF